MKKLILITVAISLITLKSNAQEGRDTPHFGLKVGTNLSNVYDSQGEKFVVDSKFGLATGAFLSIPLGKFIGLQPEILYAERGFKATGNLLGSPYDLTRTTTYIDVPLMLAIKPASFLTILAGPQYSFLVKQKNVFANSVASIEQEKVFENDNIRKNILCFTGGVDINISSIVLSARAGWDVQNNNGDGTSTTPRYKNVWYQATIGFRFL